MGCGAWWEGGTLEGMEHTENFPTETLADKVADVEAFGQAFSLLTNLSKYLDMAANAVLAGTLDREQGAAFVRRAGEVYADLREEILNLIEDGDWRVAGGARMRPLEGVEDLLEAALVVDQSHIWLETSIRRGAFTHRVKLLGLQLGLEEAAANAQLGEQREKAQTFEKRHNQPKEVGGGAYV